MTRAYVCLKISDNSNGVASWLQALLDRGLYIKDGPWKDYSTSLHFRQKYFAAMSYLYIRYFPMSVF